MAKHFAITINNWDEHQERADRANYTWFKFFSKAVDGHLWLNADNDAFRVWVYLMCKRNASEGKVFHFSDEIIAAHCKVKQRSVEKIIDSLVSLGAISKACEENYQPYAAESRDNVVLDKIRLDKRRGEETRAASPPRESAAHQSASPPEIQEIQAHEIGERLELEAYYVDQFQARRKGTPIIEDQDRDALLRLMRRSDVAPRLRRILNRYVNTENKFYERFGWDIVHLEIDIKKFAEVAA